MYKKKEPKDPNKPETRGRKRIEIDWVQFDKLCALQCTLHEIAGWFEVSISKIERAVKQEKGELYSEYYKKKSAPGKITLRRHQWQSAEKGNVTMQVWLGKQWLEQTDRVKQEVDAKTESSIALTHNGLLSLIEDLRKKKDGIS